MDFTRLTPMPGRVIVRFPRVESFVEKDGILIPGTSMHGTDEAEVLAVGGPVNEYGRMVVCPLEPGDWVVANPLYGRAYTWEDAAGEHVVRVYMASEIVARVHANTDVVGGGA